MSCISLLVALSLHVGLEGDYNDVHPHARCTIDNTIAGVYYNSESKIGAYIGQKFDAPFNSKLEIGLVTGYMDYLSNYQISKLMFLGVNLFSFIFLFLGANLRHSHVRLSYPTWLEKIFISPFQHQIHHSDHPAHFNKNLGSKLAIWDWLFGTLLRSKEVGKIKFGIGQENKDFKSFWQNIYMPFKKLFSIFSTQL